MLDLSTIFTAARSLTSPLLFSLFHHTNRTPTQSRYKHSWWLQRRCMAAPVGPATTSSPSWRMSRPPEARLTVVRLLLVTTPTISVLLTGWSWAAGPGLSFTVSRLTFLLSQLYNSRKMRGTSCICFPGNQYDNGHNNVCYVIPGCLQLYMYCIVYHILEGEGKFSFWSPDQTFFIFYLQILARLYPCSDCAEDMRSDLAESPPRVTSASEFSLWLCQLHNKVNIKLGEFSAFTNIFWQQLFFNICPIQENRSSTAAKYFSAGKTGGMMAPVTDFWPLEHCCSYCLIIIVQPSLKLDQKCLIFHYKIKSAGVSSMTLK